MGKQNWRPAWDIEGREPPWATGAASTNIHNKFGGGKYFWGNTPALDVLRLEQNEGFAYQDDVAMLFAGTCYTHVLPYLLMHNSVRRLTTCY
jgi:hypothetical protein